MRRTQPLVLQAALMMLAATLPGCSKDDGQDQCGNGTCDAGETHASCARDCPSTNNCGNGVIDSGEDCDGTDLGGADCESLLYNGGTLACDGSCAFDEADCLGSTCDNDVIEEGEDCDGTDLGGTTCQDLGYYGGDLDCWDCEFDTYMCSNCGNGVVDPAEYEDCEGTDLGAEDCESLGYFTGTLGCDVGTCYFDTSGCTNCGNNEIDYGEVCDGGSLGTTCVALGLSGSGLTCSNCLLDTSACTYTCAATALSFTGDTATATAQSSCDGTSLYSPSSDSDCTGYAELGRERVYSVTIPGGRSATIALSPNGATPGFDAALYLVSRCNDVVAATCLPGMGVDDNMSGEAETLALPSAVGARDYFIVADAFSEGSCGTFDLTVTLGN